MRWVRGRLRQKGDGTQHVQGNHRALPKKKEQMWELTSTVSRKSRRSFPAFRSVPLSCSERSFCICSAPAACTRPAARSQSTVLDVRNCLCAATLRQYETKCKGAVDDWGACSTHAAVVDVINQGALLILLELHCVDGCPELGELIGLCNRRRVSGPRWAGHKRT